MTTQKLRACKDTHGSDDTEGAEAVFAVAHRQGFVYDAERDRQQEAMCVLYLTADGERACERWVAGATPDDFSRVERAFIAETRALSPVGEHAKRFAPIVRKHPEVDGQ